MILLQQELEGFGLETNLDDNGYLFATLESNVSFDVPTVGFLAHVDTSPDFNASNVNPQIVEQYDGKTIKLGDTGRVLSQETFPELKLIGHTLMITDGTSLLGADDKAGVVEIMEAVKYLIEHPEIKHGRIRIAFTPDEEIGRGLINSMWNVSMQISLIQWTAVNLENYNLKVLMPLRLI